MSSSQFDAVVVVVLQWEAICCVLQRQKSELILLMDFMDLDSEKWSQYESASNMANNKWIYRRKMRKFYGSN